jgi:hypothetical protein
MKNSLLTLAVALIASAANAGTNAKNPVAPAVPPAPACNTLSYDFVEATWQHSFAGDGSDGYGLALNKTIAGNLFGFADFNQFFSPDEWYLGGGLGYAVPLTSCIDWVTKVGVVHSDTQFDQAWNGTVGTGFRVGLAQWLQLDVFYHGYYSDFEDYTSSGSAALIFREIIAPKVDVIVAGSVGEADYQSISAGIRYNF